MILAANIFVDLLASFIEIFLVYNILEIIYSNRELPLRQITLKVLFSLVFSVTVFMLNSISLFSYYTVLFAVIYTIITGLILFKTDLISILSIASFYYLCLGTIDFLIITIVDMIDDRLPDILMQIISSRSTERIIFIILVKVQWVGIYCLVSFLLKRYYKPINYLQYFFTISFIGFTCFFDLVKNTLKLYSINIPLSWIILTLVLCLTIACFYSYSKGKKEQLLFLHNKLLVQNYNSLSDIYTSNSILFHDLNNHFNVLQELLSENNTASALNYIHNIYLPIKNLSKTVWTGSDIIDAIINSKITLSAEHNIQMDLNVEFPGNTGIEPHDLCIILSNLLDNAIEACNQSNDEEPQYIKFIMRHINNFLIIKIVNPCIIAPKIIDGSLKTTKKDKLVHGWGLKSAKFSIYKYNGSLQYNTKDNQFITTAILFFKA